MQRILGVILLTIIIFPLIKWQGVSATREEGIDSEKVLVEVFERGDCGHCQNLKEFLETIEKTHRIKVVFYDIFTPEGKELFRAITEKAKLSQSTPVILIGTTVLQGFEAPETTGKRMEYLIEENRGQPSIGVRTYLELDVASVEKARGGTCDAERGICDMPIPEPLLVKIPLLGVVDVGQYSLPAMAGILGLIDGFNPCAMWVLVTFLIVLMQMGSRDRMLAVAGLFIVAETVMYYLILNLWFKTWDFIGMDQYVTPLVGIVALGGGLFFLYEWYTSDGTCKVTDMESRSKISNRIKKLATEPFTWLTAGGVIALAFSVNVIEFACSIGIPQAFTKILELNNLSFLSTQGLMLIYIAGYMIDDFLVFGLALWGFEKLHLTSRYSKWSNFIGGLLMLLLGLLLIFSPETLRFS